MDGCNPFLQFLPTFFRLGQVKNQIPRITVLPGHFKIEILTGEALSRMLEWEKILRIQLFPPFPSRPEKCQSRLDAYAGTASLLLSLS